MEITIDFPTVLKVTTQEYELARTEIAGLGPVRACERSQHRHEERLSAAPDAGTLACRSGCYWCCYFTVDVRAVEVLRILDFMERELTPRDRQRVRDEIRSNSAALQHLTGDERAQRNIKCPFLAAGRCSIYAARPQTCRNYHATSSAGCQKSYEEPQNDDIEPEFAPFVYQIGGAHVDAFSKAMGDAGYDTAAYELSTALAAALSEPDAVRERFEARQKPFVGLDGVTVPLEFIDEE